MSNLRSQAQALDEEAFSDLLSKSLFPAEGVLERITDEVVRAGRHGMIKLAVQAILAEIISQDISVRLAVTQAVVAALMEDILSDQDLAVLLLPWSLCYRALPED